MTDYKPEYCDKLRQHCENGMSLESFCASIKVSPQTIEDWYDRYEEFQSIMQMAPCLELYYWEQTLLTAIYQKNKEGILVAKSRIDTLSKYVTSPLKKSTYTNLKDTRTKKSSGSSRDALNDFALLQKSRQALVKS
jgi:hypothetical protein